MQPLNRPKLGDRTTGRDNHFHLIRMLAATAVLVSHAFALTGRTEPGQDLFGMNLGNLAVFVFFITSGFLVTASLQRQPSLRRFALARIVRIYPALIVMLTVTTFVAGSLWSTLPPKAYLLHPQTWDYFLSNSWMIGGALHNLPGISLTVNGSLWSLPVELRMYLILALLYAGTVWVSRRADPARTFVFVMTFVAITACALTIILQKNAHSHATLAALFFGAGAIYLFRHRWPHGPGMLVASCLTLCALGWAIGWIQACVVALPALILALAHLPGEATLRFSRLGDYSYGMYLYAFPIQKSLVMAFPAMGPYSNIIWAWLLTLLAAAFSWHLIEQPALQWLRHHLASQNHG